MGGDVNETAGDGLMVLFQDEDPERHARAAVRAAVGIQRVTREINLEREGQVPIGVHIGINSGTASVGATKIQAVGGMRWTYTASGPRRTSRRGSARSRVPAKASWSAKRRAAALAGGFRLRDLGLQTLKNVQRPVRAWRVDGEAIESLGAVD